MPYRKSGACTKTVPKGLESPERHHLCRKHVGRPTRSRSVGAALSRTSGGLLSRFPSRSLKTAWIPFKILDEQEERVLPSQTVWGSIGFDLYRFFGRSFTGDAKQALSHCLAIEGHGDVKRRSGRRLQAGPKIPVGCLAGRRPGHGPS